MNKREEFKCLLEKENPSLVFLVETKLNADIANMEIFDVNKYEVYRKDRVEQNAPGGGVAVLVKKSLVSTCNSIRFINHHAYAEAVWCEIKLEGNNILVGSVYRAPSSGRDVNNLLCDLFRLTDNYDKESQVLICGDFNYNEILWESNTVERDGQFTVDAGNFLDAVNDTFLIQHVEERTHNIDYANPTRLDLIFSRNEVDVKNLNLLAPLGKSHHATIAFEYVLASEVLEAEIGDRYKYCFHKGDYDMIRRNLSVINWEERFEGKSLVEKYEILVSVIINLIEQYVPKVKCAPGSPKPKWMTKEVKDQINAKEKAWKRLKARKTNLREIKYRQVRNLVTSMVRAAKKAFEKQLCKDIKVNPKHFWSFIRSKSKVKENVTKVRKPNGELSKNDQETADVFNNAFQSVFVVEDRQNPQNLVWIKRYL